MATTLPSLNEVGATSRASSIADLTQDSEAPDEIELAEVNQTSHASSVTNVDNLNSIESSVTILKNESVTPKVSLEFPKPSFAAEPPPRDVRFWMVFLGIGVATVITALELSAVSTALPYIVNDLGGYQFAWVGSAYALAATAFIPLSGGIAEIFGRKVVALSSMLIMAVGSALCGASTSLNFLIAGRTIQGLGGGGITAINAILISDLVPLRERGVFNGLIGIAYAVAAGVGPIVGGALADAGAWRWLFYLNIPVCAISASLMIFFLRVPTPEGTMKEKLNRMDWIGNMLVIGASTATVIALTWGGIEKPWSSSAVLVPLILGLVGLVAFVVYEALIPEYPVLPFSLMTSRTALGGYLQAFLMPVVMVGVIYYMPVYYEACKGATAIKAGVYELTFSLILMPFGIISGLSVKKTQQYCPQLWVAWVFVIVGVGLLTLVKENSPLGWAIGFLAILSPGIGILSTTTYFPVLAPIPISQNAPALAFFMFLRNFAQVWGVSIGGTVLQNELRKRLPVELASQIPGGAAIAYSAIPLIKSLPEPLQSQVRAAFADSLTVVWQVFLGITALGLLSSLLMKRLPLHTNVDRRWTMTAELRNQASGLSLQKV